jgi:YfiH family protein
MSAGWISAEWKAPAGIIAGTTLRPGGVSLGQFASLNLGGHVGDDPENVARNRLLFKEMCALPADPAWLQQEHGTQVARNPTKVGISADAVYSNQSGAVCAVLTADCLPVLLCSDDGVEIAAAHAGWRGLCDGVIEAAIAEFDAPTARIIAWLGPAIGQRAFEVGGEVREAFLQVDAAAESCFTRNDRGRWQADLYGIARQRLAACGIQAVAGGTYCTHTEANRFFSYRRDGECGRMATFIARKSI